MSLLSPVQPLAGPSQGAQAPAAAEGGAAPSDSDGTFGAMFDAVAGEDAGTAPPPGPPGNGGPVHDAPAEETGEEPLPAIVTADLTLPQPDPVTGLQIIPGGVAPQVQPGAGTATLSADGNFGAVASAEGLAPGTLASGTLAAGPSATRSAIPAQTSSPAEGAGPPPAGPSGAAPAASAPSPAASGAGQTAAAPPAPLAADAPDQPAPPPPAKDRHGQAILLSAHENALTGKMLSEALGAATDAVATAGGAEMALPGEATLPNLPAETRRTGAETAAPAQRAGQDGPPPAERQIVSAILSSGTGRTDILLDPQDLGRVRLSLEGNETGIVVTIQAERSETADLLRRNADLLVQEFREAGYTDLTFSFAGGGETAAAPDRQDESPAPAGGEGLATPPPPPTHPGPRGSALLDLRL